MLTSVRVPEPFVGLFEIAEKYVGGLFEKVARDPSKGSIHVGGQRYVLVRGESLFIALFDQLSIAFGEQEAQEFIYNLARIIGKSDSDKFAEEMGLIGVLTLLVLFAVFLHSGWRIARGCPVPALRLVAIGLTVSIVLQAAINIAVASAMAPTKGIPLPFISHGSSGLVVLLLQVGILVGIARIVPSTAAAEAKTPEAESASTVS